MENTNVDTFYKYSYSGEHLQCLYPDDNHCFKIFSRETIEFKPTMNYWTNERICNMWSDLFSCEKNYFHVLENISHNGKAFRWTLRQNALSFSKHLKHMILYWSGEYVVFHAFLVRYHISSCMGKRENHSNDHSYCRNVSRSLKMSRKSIDWEFPCHSAHFEASSLYPSLPFHIHRRFDTSRQNRQDRQKSRIIDWIISIGSMFFISNAHSVFSEYYSPVSLVCVRHFIGDQEYDSVKQIRLYNIESIRLTEQDAPHTDNTAIGISINDRLSLA